MEVSIDPFRGIDRISSEKSCSPAAGLGSGVVMLLYMLILLIEYCAVDSGRAKSISEGLFNGAPCVDWNWPDAGCWNPSFLCEEGSAEGMLLELGFGCGFSVVTWR